MTKLEKTQMSVADVAPDLQRGVRKIPNVPVYKRWVLNMTRLATQLGFFQNKNLPGVTHRDIALGNASVRVYTGEEKTSGIGVLWIHGGGLIAGSNKIDNKMCSRYVLNLDAVVVSVEYRLAPDHPYPAGLDDCYEAWNWLVDHIEELELDPKKLIVAGQSGGGCLAASLVQTIYDRGGVQPAAQLLFCPMLDDRTGGNEEHDAIRHLGWTNRNNRAAWTWYLGKAAGAKEVPQGSVPARRENLEGLAPAWVGIGDIDLFYNESREYVSRLNDAGVETIFDVVPNAPHGFEIFVDDTNTVRDYFARHFDAVRGLVLGAEGNDR